MSGYNRWVMRISLREASYAVAWVVLLAALGLALTWWLLLRTPGALFGPVDPGEVDVSEQREDNPPAQTIEERAGQLEAEVSGLDFTVSSDEGYLVMHVSADRARADGKKYEIDEGTMRFMLENRETLLLRVTNACFRRESGVARVSGTLAGEIPDSNQRFLAEELIWDQSTNTLSTLAVHYSGPNLSVRAERMTIDLSTGTVTFEGPVNAEL